MSFNAPIKIHINSDDNELVLVGSNKGFYYYEYVKSKHKKGLKLPLTEAQLIKLLEINSNIKQ